MCNQNGSYANYQPETGKQVVGLKFWPIQSQIDCDILPSGSHGHSKSCSELALLFKNLNSFDDAIR